MKKIKDFFTGLYNFFVNNYKLIFGCIAVFCLVSIGYQYSQHNFEKQYNEMRLNIVREYVYNPSMYKLDTLYRKRADTLFIDTIKVNYNK